MLELNKANFEDEVFNSEGYVFVDFWGETCEPCKALMPGVHELADKYGDKIKFCSLNIADARRMAIKCGVLGLPAMRMFKDGEKVDEINQDDASIENIEAMIQKYL